MDITSRNPYLQKTQKQIKPYKKKTYHKPQVLILKLFINFQVKNLKIF